MFYKIFVNLCHGISISLVRWNIYIYLYKTENRIVLYVVNGVAYLKKLNK